MLGSLTHGYPVLPHGSLVLLGAYVCRHVCMYVCMYVLSNRECHCCKTSLQNSFCLDFPAQHSLAQYKQGTFSRACLDNNLEKTMASERAWC